MFKCPNTFDQDCGRDRLPAVCTLFFKHEDQDIHLPKDCTLVSQLIIKGLLTILQLQKKVTVLLLSQFLLGLSATELKSLSLDVTLGFGSAKPYYKQRNGRKQLQSLIYHLIVKGINQEEIAGATEKPTVLLNKCNTEKLMDNMESILF